MDSLLAGTFFDLRLFEEENFELPRSSKFLQVQLDWLPVAGGRAQQILVQ